MIQYRNLKDWTKRFAKFISDLIQRLKDVSEKLILAKAISEYASKKDSTSYVWKQMKEFKDSKVTSW